MPVQYDSAAMMQARVTPTSMVAAVSGIITQFIGVTFMVIYRSTMAQANAFMVVLDRINSVGMAFRYSIQFLKPKGN